MADYRDLLRRAIEALPENNGNARRQVYDKARAALRKQLDAIQPELPSREKTHHRLQLEECIREVEQEATERMLSGLSQLEQDNFGAGAGQSHETDDDAEDESDAIDTSGGEDEAPSFAPEHHYASEPQPQPVVTPAPPPRPAISVRPAPQSGPKPEVTRPADEAAAQPRPRFEIKRPSVESVAARPAPVPVAANPLPTTIVPSPAPMASEPPVVIPVKTDATGLGSTDAALHAHAVVGVEPAMQPHVSMEPGPVVVPSPDKPDSVRSRLSSRMSSFVPGMGGGQQSKATRAEPAMSTEREVDVDHVVADPQTAIDHAIAVLDREASGNAALGETTLDTADPDMADLAFAKAEGEDEGGSPALLILLIVMLVVFAGGLGAAWWAWHEGYLDGKMFGIGDAQTTSDTVTTSQSTPAVTSPPEPVRQIGETPDASTGTEIVEATRPGNTVATPGVVETPATGLQPADGNAADPVADNALALAPTDDPAAAASPTMDAAGAGGNVGNTASQTAADAAATIAEPTPGDDKTEDRLPVADIGAADSVAAADPSAQFFGCDGRRQSVVAARSLGPDQCRCGALFGYGRVDARRR